MKLTFIALVGLFVATLSFEAAAAEMSSEYLVKEVLNCTGCHGKNLAGRDRKFGDDAGRRTMLEIFHLLGTDSELVGKYRRMLASALY